MERSNSVKSATHLTADGKRGDGSDEEGRVVVESARPSAEQDSLSLDDLFDPSKTAKENKSTLVSYELDRMGMGRYQWCVFFLCGLGFFIDLLWAQATALILVPLENEPGFNVSSSNVGDLSMAFAIGLTVGAFSWGILVDVIGRRWSFNITCLISGAFGTASGGAPSFTALRILFAFVGLGVGGNIPIDATITLEILPTNRRFLLAMLSLFQPIGVIVASGIAYGFIPRYSCGGGLASMINSAACSSADNRGWRYYLYTLGAITLFIFVARFVVFNFRESPAYLINRGFDEKALASVASIAKTNRSSPLQFGIADFREIERRCNDIDGTRDRATLRAEEFSSRGKVSLWQTLQSALLQTWDHLKTTRLLFHNFKMARITILLWITFAADFFGFSIAGTYLVLILADRTGQSSGGSLSETYRDYIAIYTPGIAGCLIGALMIETPRLGRQWSMVFASSLMAVSLFLFATVSSKAGSVGLNALEYIAQSLFNSILYAFVPEAYPSSIRGTASGLTSTIGRIASIVAPIAGNAVYGSGSVNAARNVIYVGGGVTLLCPLALALLPFDTRGVRTF